MILVDTSIWIDHFRSPDPRLVELLDNQRVLGHPWITGERAMGNLGNRVRILALLQSLPQAPIVELPQLLSWIGESHLHGLGLGLVDAQVLASSLAHADVRLWTRDRRLGRAAAIQGRHFLPPEIESHP